jgi:uracil-DNA glycosylase
MKSVKVIIGLGKIGFDAITSSYRELGLLSTPCKPKFVHGFDFHLNTRVTLIGSYHPSQQNTFTKRLTEPMFDAVFEKAKSILS